MGLFSRLFSRKAGIQSLPEFSTWPESKTGVQINTSRALEVATVLACSRAIAEGVAQVPIKFYRIDPVTGRHAPLLSHPLLSVLGRRPNPWQTSFEFRETLLFHLVLCGNAFVYVNRVRDQVQELIPIEPGKVLVDRKPDMSLTYQITWDDGRSPILTTRDVWHLRGPSWNSWMGLEAIKLAREAIGLALATEEAHARLHKNGVRPSGVWSVDGSLTEQQHEQLSRWLTKHYAGSDNGGKPLVMDRAAKWSQQMMSGVDAQHLETRKHQVEEICRAMRVIPMMAGHSDKASTYASAEQMFIAHVVHTITPWATRIEQSAERALLGDETDIDIRFDLKGLMRGAAKDRAEYLSRALGSGGSPAWMTQNEARYEDGLDWIEGGDELSKLPTQMQADGGDVNAAA